MSTPPVKTDSDGSWLLRALAGLALTGAVTISGWAVKEAQNARQEASDGRREAAAIASSAKEALVRFEATDYLRVRDLPLHIVPGPETLRRMERLEKDVEELRRDLRELERQFSVAPRRQR